MLHHYFNNKIDEEYMTNINNLTILNDINIIDHSFYNSDIVINKTIDYIYPIFVLYKDKDKISYIKNINFYNLIDINEDNQFNIFINYLNEYIIYDYITIIFIDEVYNKFDKIIINNSIENYNIMNILLGSKKKSHKKKYKTIPKIDSYEAFICNNNSRVIYISNNKS